VTVQAGNVQVDTSQTQEPDDWGDGEIYRYIAVSE
jgi:hypothetical protein